MSARPCTARLYFWTAATPTPFAVLFDQGSTCTSMGSSSSSSSSRRRRSTFACLTSPHLTLPPSPTHAHEIHWRSKHLALGPCPCLGHTSSSSTSTNITVSTANTFQDTLLATSASLPHCRRLLSSLAACSPCLLLLLLLLLLQGLHERVVLLRAAPCAHTLVVV